MTEEGKAVAVKEPSLPAVQTYELLQRKAKALALSGLMPKEYSGNNLEAQAKCLIAAEMADRMGMNAVSVAQNLHIIQGKPSWSSSFVIAAINHSGAIKGRLRFKLEKRGELAPVTYTQVYWVSGTKKTKEVTVSGAPDWTCHAEGTCAETGEILTGPTIDLTMAIKEGWYDKPGSKWKTMLELMIQYRAAAFFGRLYVPEILAGLHHDDEVRDMRQAREVAPESELQSTLDNLVEEEGAEPVEAELLDEEEECNHEWETQDDGTANCLHCGETA